MAKTTKNTKTATDTNKLHIYGTLTYVSRGIDKKFNKDNTTEKTNFTIKPYEDGYDMLTKAFEGNGSKYTPAFVKGESEYLTLKSQFDIPLFVNGKQVCKDVYEVIEKELPVMNAEVEVIIKCNDGAIYPLGINIRKWGTVLKQGVDASDFDAVDVEDIEELPFN